MCLHVCRFVSPHDISKRDVPRIAKLDTDMVNHESWKPIYFGVKQSKFKVTRLIKRLCRFSERTQY